MTFRLTSQAVEFTVTSSRERPHAGAHVRSVERRMAEAARRPEQLSELLAWFREEMAAEIPSRLHERGTEPESALGAPRLHGAFRAYLMGSPYQTDHDDRLDPDERHATRVRPMQRALAVMSKRWPLSARYLFAIAFMGAEWQDVALAWQMLPEIGHRFTRDALAHLWDIWARDQIDRPSEIV